MNMSVRFGQILTLFLVSYAKADILCPAETDKKPLAMFIKNSKVSVFACGSVDENRAPPPGKVWMTKINIYTLKEDGTPQAVLENESEVKNYFVNVEKNGIRAEEFILFDQTPQPIFSTYVNCDDQPCSTKTRCLKSPHKFKFSGISTKTLSQPEQAEEHLRNVFRAGLGGDKKARNFFKNTNIKNALDSTVRDQFNKYEQTLKSYEDLGC